ncbi:neuromedin Bb [Gadus chalcogrammus]|uniref:neuromedin Bb n=1 Tax=Gadus chalcogrammus TaxID=1042646 RepID=UPI0024C4BCAD|nr:neuromedin Bb [Gadus chalcogrammus]
MCSASERPHTELPVASSWGFCAPRDSAVPVLAMSGLTLSNVCHGALLTYLVFFSVLSLTTAVSFDLTELRNKVAKIKVNPRGNLWATGHFMGKKSVMDKPLLSPADGQGVDALQVALGPEQDDLGNIFQEVLRVALQAQIDTQETRSKKQESELLMKILESYVDSSKK